MIVVPVDDGDFGIYARERLRGEESAETRADDHDSRAHHSMVAGRGVSKAGIYVRAQSGAPARSIQRSHWPIWNFDSQPAKARAGAAQARVQKAWHVSCSPSALAVPCAVGLLSI